MAMTNREKAIADLTEWLKSLDNERLESLSDEELAETLDSCTVCARKNTRFCCDNIEKTCSKGVQEWLKQEHKE